MTDRRSTSGPQAVVSLVTLLLMPPLGPIVWILMSGNDRPAYLRSRLVLAGLTLLVLSALPLLYVILATPSGLPQQARPNPIGLGLIFVAGIAVSTVMATAGAMLTYVALGREA